MGKESERVTGTHELESASEGQVRRTRKESERPPDTHELERASGGRSEDIERTREGDGFSLPGEWIGRDN
jgi:hypothetical protein